MQKYHLSVERHRQLLIADQSLFRIHRIIASTVLITTVNRHVLVSVRSVM